MLTAFDIALAWLRLYRLQELIWGKDMSCVVMIVPTQMLMEMQQTVEKIEEANRKTLRLVKG
jgi:hypothetical protein